MNPLNNNAKVPNITSLYQKFMQNPAQALMQSGFNIPDNIANNPRQIAQHLLNSGQISQSKLNAIQQAVTQMGIKL